MLKSEWGNPRLSLYRRRVSFLRQCSRISIVCCLFARFSFQRLPNKARAPSSYMLHKALCQLLEKTNFSTIKSRLFIWVIYVLRQLRLDKVSLNHQTKSVDTMSDFDDFSDLDSPPVIKSKQNGKRISIERIYQKKSQLEHILLRPDTYIGSVEIETKVCFYSFL